MIAGEGRDEPGALIFPSGSFLKQEIQAKLETFARQSTGSSNRIARLLVLDEPPSLDAGEMTDKGTINQKRVLENRTHLVDELYRAPPSESVIWI